MSKAEANARAARVLDLFDRLYEASGSNLAELARRLGEKYTTVDGWRRRNRVPYWREEPVLQLAKEAGLNGPGSPRPKRGARRKKVH